jgi:hypothetical protein
LEEIGLGEASRRRKKLKDQVFTRFTNCIYCGGDKSADTVDHFPARTFFDNKHRPRGLEFPACRACNAGSRLDELAASAMARIYPDPDTEQQKAEVKQLLGAVRNNIPGFLEEMLPTWRQKVNAASHPIIMNGGGVLNASGPILNKAINRVAAKAGFALHFELFGAPVPLGGGVVAWWYTNYQAENGDMPHSLLRMLGHPRTLVQGKFNVAGQFLYSSVGSSDGRISAHFATFRSSFAICAFASSEEKSLSFPQDVEPSEIFRPGWLAT